MYLIAQVLWALVAPLVNSYITADPYHSLIDIYCSLVEARAWLQLPGKLSNLADLPTPNGLVSYIFPIFKSVALAQLLRGKRVQLNTLKEIQKTQ